MLKPRGFTTRIRDIPARFSSSSFTSDSTQTSFSVIYKRDLRAGFQELQFPCMQSAVVMCLGDWKELWWREV